MEQQTLHLAIVPVLRASRRIEPHPACLGYQMSQVWQTATTVKIVKAYSENIDPHGYHLLRFDMFDDRMWHQDPEPFLAQLSKILTAGTIACCHTAWAWPWYLHGERGSPTPFPMMN